MKRVIKSSIDDVTQFPDNVYYWTKTDYGYRCEIPWYYAEIDYDGGNNTYSIALYDRDQRVITSAGGTGFKNTDRAIARVNRWLRNNGNFNGD